MATTFTWSILDNGLMTQTVGSKADAVVQVRYKITATDGTTSVDMIQMAQLEPPTPSKFVAFGNLTEAKVLGWVKASLRPNQEAQFEATLARMLELKANPPVRPVAKAAPWNTCSPA